MDNNHLLKHLQHLKIAAVARESLLTAIDKRISKAKKIFSKYDPKIMDPIAFYHSQQMFMKWFHRYIRTGISKIKALENCVKTGDAKLFHDVFGLIQGKLVPGIFIPVPAVCFDETPHEFTVVMSGDWRQGNTSIKSRGEEVEEELQNATGISEVGSTEFKAACRSSGSVIQPNSESALNKSDPEQSNQEGPGSSVSEGNVSTASVSQENIGNSGGDGHRQSWTRGRASGVRGMYFTSSGSFPELPQILPSGVIDVASMPNMETTDVASMPNLEANVSQIQRPGTPVSSTELDLEQSLDAFEVAMSSSSERIRNTIVELQDYVSELCSIGASSSRPSQARSLERLESQEYFGRQGQHDGDAEMKCVTRKSSSETSVIFTFQRSTDKAESKSVCPMGLRHLPMLPSFTSFENCKGSASLDAFFDNAVSELRRELSSPALTPISEKRLSTSPAASAVVNQITAKSTSIHLAKALEESAGSLQAAEENSDEESGRQEMEACALFSETLESNGSDLEKQLSEKGSEIRQRSKEFNQNEPRLLAGGRIRRKPNLPCRIPRRVWKPDAPWRFAGKNDLKCTHKSKSKEWVGVGTWKNRLRRMVKKKEPVERPPKDPKPEIGTWNNHLHRMPVQNESVEPWPKERKPEVGNWVNSLHKIVIPKESAKPSLKNPKPEVGNWSNCLQKMVIHKEYFKPPPKVPKPEVGTWNSSLHRVFPQKESVEARPVPSFREVGTWEHDELLVKIPRGAEPVHNSGEIDDWGSWRPKWPRGQQPPPPRGPLMEFKEPFPIPRGRKEWTYTELGRRRPEPGSTPLRPKISTICSKDPFPMPYKSNREKTYFGLRKKLVAVGARSASIEKTICIEEFKIPAVMRNAKISVPSHFVPPRKDRPISRSSQKAVPLTRTRSYSAPSTRSQALPKCGSMENGVESERQNFDFGKRYGPPSRAAAIEFHDADFSGPGSGRPSHSKYDSDSDESDYEQYSRAEGWNADVDFDKLPYPFGTNATNEKRGAGIPDSTAEEQQPSSASSKGRQQ